jgi:hypothetical protein
MGVDPRGFWALARTFLLADLRGQHFARATALGPGQVLSPLFLVVGILFTVSAAASLVLFARVDVFFFAFVNLSLSMLAMAAVVVVEFNEVVLDPRDLEVIGHRPVSTRTYAAARFANLLFYFVLFFLALNLFPLIVGAGLRDAGPWYLAAYLTAALAGNLAVTCLVILLLSLPRLAGRLEPLKDVLAWTQTALLLVVGYGAQLLLRDVGYGFQLWGAFPPGWVAFLPPAWLARFVEAAAFEPGSGVLGVGLLLLLLILAAAAVTLGWLSRLYRQMEPVAVTWGRRPMAPARVGGLQGTLAAWLTRTPAERVGFWLCGKLLAREGGLKMRCLWPLNMAVAVVVLGLLADQFDNPLHNRPLERVALPVLSVYLLALAVPGIVHGLTFSRDGEAADLLRTAPLERPAGVARGVARAVLVLLVTPLCVVWGLIAWAWWGDPLAAVLHAGLAWLLSWLTALVAQGIVLTAAPFSRPAARGSSAGPVNLPMAILATVLFLLCGLHWLLAPFPWFWIGLGLLGLAAWRPLERLAAARSLRLWGAGA